MCDRYSHSSLGWGGIGVCSGLQSLKANANLLIKVLRTPLPPLRTGNFVKKLFWEILFLPSLVAVGAFLTIVRNAEDLLWVFAFFLIMCGLFLFGKISEKICTLLFCNKYSKPFFNGLGAFINGLLEIFVELSSWIFGIVIVMAVLLAILLAGVYFINTNPLQVIAVVLILIFLAIIFKR